MFIPLVNQAVLYNNMYITTAGMRYNLEDNYMSCFFFFNQNTYWNVG